MAKISTFNDVRLGQIVSFYDGGCQLTVAEVVKVGPYNVDVQCVDLSIMTISLNVECKLASKAQRIDFMNAMYEIQQEKEKLKNPEKLTKIIDLLDILGKKYKITVGKKFDPEVHLLYDEYHRYGSPTVLSLMTHPIDLADLINILTCEKEEKDKESKRIDELREFWKNVSTEDKQKFREIFGMEPLSTYR